MKCEIPPEDGCPLKEELEEAQNLIMDLVVQGCGNRSGELWELESMAITAHADGIEYLAKIGRVRLHGERHGRMVAGEILPGHRWRDRSPK